MNLQWGLTIFVFWKEIFLKSYKYPSLNIISFFFDSKCNALPRFVGSFTAVPLTPVLFLLQGYTSIVFLWHLDLVSWAMVDFDPLDKHFSSWFSSGFLYQISVPLFVFQACALKGPSDNCLFSSPSTSQSVCCRSLRCQAFHLPLPPPAPLPRSPNTFITRRCLLLHLHFLQVLAMIFPKWVSLLANTIPWCMWAVGLQLLEWMVPCWLTSSLPSHCDLGI